MPKEAIRVDNVFTRLPIHRIAKKGHARIRIIEREPAENGGQIRLYWKVDPNNSVGEPGPLAYRVDTVVINRILDETGIPLPRILPLGDLRPIARELGLGGDTNALKQALKQNAFAGITAKLCFRDRAGNEHWIDNYFTRYNVIFRGGIVDGRRAECAYLLLNDPYYSALNSTVRRPLDYEYMKRLTPAGQRWYELISPHMFAMFCNGWAYAQIPYSEFCAYSTLTRYGTRTRIQSQLARIHRRHLAAGYISQVEYRSRPGTKDDLLLRYYPGPKAIVEHLAFNNEIAKGPYRMKRGDMDVKHLFRSKRRSQSRRTPNLALSGSNESAQELVVRFATLRHGVDSYCPDDKDLDVARKLLNACDGAWSLAEETIVVAAEAGRESGDPTGYPSHIAGVLKGPYIEIARNRLLERQETQRRIDDRDRGRRLEAQYATSMADRARRRLDAVTENQKQRIIGGRLAAVLDEYRYLVTQRGWDRTQARAWAEPRILEAYGHDGEPSLEHWLAARHDDSDRPERIEPTDS